MAKIERLLFNQDSANTYVYGDEGKPCIVFDLGMGAGKRIIPYADKHHNGMIAAIFITHGHYDHFAGLNEEDKLSGLATFLPMEDFDAFYDPSLNESFSLGGEAIKLREDIRPYEVEDQDEISLIGVTIKAIWIPFHTKGSLCYYIEEEKALIAGDVLFNLGIGRSDLRLSRPRLLESSLKKLSFLDDDVKVYPGHGPMTSMGKERRLNPYGYLFHKE